MKDKQQIRDMCYGFRNWYCTVSFAILENSEDEKGVQAPRQSEGFAIGISAGVSDGRGGGCFSCISLNVNTTPVGIALKELTESLHTTRFSKTDDSHVYTEYMLRDNTN